MQCDVENCGINTAFTSNTQGRITTTSVPLIEPSHVVALPKGQCFALIEGGNRWKVRMPLPAPDPDEAMPKDLQELAGYMRQHYVDADMRINRNRLSQT